MKTFRRSKIAFFTSALFCSGCIQAATATGNINATGTIEAANVCTLAVPTTVDFGTQTNNTVIDQAFSVTINCTNGLGYSLTSPANNAVTIGSGSHYLTVIDSSTNPIATTPATGTGTGADTTRNLTMRLHGTTSISSPIPVASFGTFNVVIPMTLTY